ncbi:prevent-host-death protein [Staphylococcus devriesei]|uniref:type II toxin-antitoxin system Phd/YefM family antitoxin n=1 Tax=Staphylococcus devriesei TaxID=586733 RepID=UPI000E692D26|nr:type II toxin-antitoxin system Phd/YefM family antitoxin [Staphylococcus devriesei]RIL68937.1 prevent-host-death protein [Staphylococcus devriesei]
MIIKSYSYVCTHLKDMINKINDNNEIIKITSKGGNAILRSEDNYNGIVETLYLQQDPTNAKHLLESIENLEQGNIKTDNLHKLPLSESSR